MFHPGNPVEGNEQIALGDTVRLLDGRAVPVVNVYGDEHGRVGDVQATLVVDDE